MGQAIPDRLFWARGDATGRRRSPAAGEPDGLARPPWAVSDHPDTTDSLRLFSQCLRVLPAPARLLQYRNKSTDPALRLAQAQTLRALTRAAGVGLIINDDVALAAQWAPTACTWAATTATSLPPAPRPGEHAILGARATTNCRWHAPPSPPAPTTRAFGAARPPPPN